jgi:hypothetical protein
MPPIVATTSQKYHGRKFHPLRFLKTTDSKIIDSMAQNIVIAIPTATRLQTFISLPSLNAVVALIILLALLSHQLLV